MSLINYYIQLSYIDTITYLRSYHKGGLFNPVAYRREAIL